MLLTRKFRCHQPVAKVVQGGFLHYNKGVTISLPFTILN